MFLMVKKIRAKSATSAKIRVQLRLARPDSTRIVADVADFARILFLGYD
jgi:hypothetical protein